MKYFYQIFLMSKFYIYLIDEKGVEILKDKKRSM